MEQLPSRLSHEEITEVPRIPQVLDRIFVGRLRNMETPSVKNVTRFIASGFVGNLTFFRDGQDGQEIQVLGDGTTTVVHNVAFIVTLTSADVLLALGKVYKFTMFNGIWYEH